jgi:tubulin--tyrosine ligase
LYNKRKFDIRTYLLITIVNSNIKGYWYRQGYIRTSGKIFSLDNLDDIMVHLTNDAVQKYDNSYGKYEEGNKVSYVEMEKYLNSNGKMGGWRKIYESMKDIATRIVEASETFLDQGKRENFELFGLDFLVDENLKTYLLEVNYNPCLETGCPVL